MSDQERVSGENLGALYNGLSARQQEKLADIALGMQLQKELTERKAKEVDNDKLN